MLVGGVDGRTVAVFVTSLDPFDPGRRKIPNEPKRGQQEDDHHEDALAALGEGYAGLFKKRTGDEKRAYICKYVLFHCCCHACLFASARISEVYARVCRQREACISTHNITPQPPNPPSPFFSQIPKKMAGDGCSVFWRTRRFRLQRAEEVEYLVPGTRHLDRDNVGVVAVLEDLAGPREEEGEGGKGGKKGSRGEEKGKERRRRRRLLVVANTHLLFNPRRGDVKLAQVQVLLRRLEVRERRGWRSVAG